MKEINFAVIGADQRLLAAVDALRKKGMGVFLFGEEAFSLAEADAVLLPLPMSQDGIAVNNTNGRVSVASLLAEIGENTPVFAGRTAPFSDKRLIDYTKETLFAVKNAVPTAEGALAIVLKETDITVRGMHVCVTGFGKVGRATASLFHAAGAKVTVFARREEIRAEAEGMGYHSQDISALAEYAKDFDTLINTVPELILDRSVLSGVRRDALILDLASAPGGVDFTYAEKIGLRTIHALALPGKYCPKTAGAVIADTVLSVLETRFFDII